MHVKKVFWFMFLWLIFSHGAKAEEANSEAFNIGGIQILADEPNYWDFGVGVFDFNEESRAEKEAAAFVEFRYGKKLFYLWPALGILANTDGGVFGYGGPLCQYSIPKLCGDALFGFRRV